MILSVAVKVVLKNEAGVPMKTFDIQIDVTKDENEFEVFQETFSNIQGLMNTALLYTPRKD